jgi:hypothetical protein
VQRKGRERRKEIQEHPLAAGILPEMRLSDVFQERPTGLGSFGQLVRLAVAVVASWLIARAVSESSLSIFAPITTLFVFSTSPWSALGLSVQRIVSTGLGVFVASLWVNWAGVVWWSILIALLVSLFAARALPMSIGGQYQIPVAVIFVLAIGPGSLEQDVWRVLDVAIGGTIGLLAVYLPPPRPKPEKFESAMQDYRDNILDRLRDIGVECGSWTEPLKDGEQHKFLAPTRELRGLAEKCREELVALAQATQFNPRGRTVRPELIEDAVRLRRLSGIGVQVRGLAGAAHRLYDQPGLPPALSPELFGSLMFSLADVGEEVLGQPGTPVRTQDPEQSARAVLTLDRQLRQVADTAVVPAGTGASLESLSLLGRLTLLVAQLQSFGEEATEDDDE